MEKLSIYLCIKNLILKVYHALTKSHQHFKKTIQNIHKFFFSLQINLCIHKLKKAQICCIFNFSEFTSPNKKFLFLKWRFFFTSKNIKWSSDHFYVFLYEKLEYNVEILIFLFFFLNNLILIIFWSFFLLFIKTWVL